ncbi:MAG: YqgE/AlgH family protein [Alphaproteobacteria bacterium]|nr:YqgE/AlgH family protein [Alphaproteobacteria bacterium]MDE2494459.1 YqgE/AlgH family protein [Alphaproteobacteria bacterium]
MAPPKIKAETSDESFLEGKLLIALPGMADPRFEKSVIFMCAHSAKGAMGLIINKPIAGLTLRDLMPKLSIDVAMPVFGAPIMFGGPVQIDRGYVLHSAEYGGRESTLSITSDISLTATVNVLTAISEGRGPSKSILALGYAGWGAGQIESELQANGWLHCDADAHLIFDSPSDTKWQSALARLGADISGLSAEAGRA